MKYKSTLLNSIKIHKSWKTFLTEDKDLELANIEKQINLKSKITPSSERVLKFLEMDLSNVKVLILGQDPYPQEGVATGRAFEVGNLFSWSDKFRNISLKNIVRAIYNTYHNGILKYNDIKPLVGEEFSILSPDKLFKNWEKQGVMLLNTSFTCKIGEAGSHVKLWSDFSASLLNFIVDYNSEITWFIWGGAARKITESLSIKKQVVTSHPMMCYKKENDFLYGENNCFKLTKKIINWQGDKT